MITENLNNFYPPQLEERRRAANQENSKLNSLSTLVFYLAILFFIIGFNFSDVMVGNWYQQFLPFPAGGQIKDIYFVDSLLGFAVTDSSILKTTNSGDNWAVKLNGFYIFQRIQFLNANTGFACGGNNRLLKTTNSGENWTIDTPASIFPNDMAVLNEDTIWLASSSNPTGGVYRTTNGGVSWQNQLSLGSQNPAKIYMFNSRIGFTSTGAGLYKTTNSGALWSFISADGAFSDMFFIDSLTGWKANGFMKKTTDGGSNWVVQALPIGNFLGNGATNFMNIDNDTIWATGETMIVGGSPPTRGILFRTTNGGNNWLFQLPDTSIHINRYPFGQFIDNKYGWAYNFNAIGIHTVLGGDTTFLGLHQISSEVPKQIRLYQNYPNPFNPKTIIRYQILRSTDVKIIVFDVLGKLVIELVNKTQTAGTYETDFSSIGCASGIYFYSLFTDDKLMETRKMLLVK